MCGICGFVGPDSLDVLERMTTALAHRGPDGSGTWQSADGQVAFGHRRLSIVDLAGGAQPMVSHDGRYVITFNGEIYNHRSLRRILEGKGATFRSDHSDTEVILEGFRWWGDGVETHLNGMWAFALYDQVTGRLRLSRDRLGKKPLYYSVVGDRLIFASELGSLRQHPQLRQPTVSTLSVQKYFAYGYIPAPRTIYNEVAKLPAGHTLTFDATRRHGSPPTCYWRYEPDPAPPSPLAFGEGVDHLRSALQAAVSRRLEADVPVGVFLSGGVDSSATAAFACRLRAPRDVKTFSIGFTEPSFDESAYARQVAEALGTDHREERLSMDRAVEGLPQLGTVLDEPMADSSLLPTELLSRFARTEVKVALGGDGGDELFAGYDPFLALRRAEQYQRLVPRPMHRALLALVGRLPVSHQNMSLDFRLKRTLRGLSHPASLWLPQWMAPVADAAGRGAGLFTHSLEDIFSEAIACWERLPGEDLVGRTVRFYLELYLQNDILTKVDRASMRHGLEVRAPFLDLEVVNLARAMPSAWKLHDGRTKHVLKEALRGLLPPNIIERKKKGFGVPIGSWFKRGALTLNPEKSTNPVFAKHCLDQHRAGRSDERAYLWAEWVLEAWQSAQ